MGQNFLGASREQAFLLAPDVREWLAEGHFAWFVIDAVAKPWPPAPLLIAHCGTRLVASGAEGRRRREFTRVTGRYAACASRVRPPDVLASQSTT
jgi:hypothetical protein